MNPTTAQWKAAKEPSMLCSSCGEKIPEGRLKAVPGTRYCTVCAEEVGKGQVDAPWPKPPADKAICPYCYSPTVVRQNAKDMSFFLGCSAFPKCRWTAEWPVDPSWPKPPEGRTECPRCHSATVVRQNQRDKSFFLGCSAFPRCRWTARLS